jgi:uncharacterized protein
LSSRSGRFAVLLALVASAGCARLFSSYDVAPDGLQRSEYEFRHYLAAGHADSALLQLTHAKKKRQLPQDDLLRLLFEGVAAHYAGDTDRSAAVFDRAALVAEDRSTKSISKAALSVVVNDLSLAYEPSPTERLLLPYYAALTYANAGRFEQAAVEARRLSSLLQRMTDEDADAIDVRTHGFLRYFAGSIFEAAGETADAEVAYRNARALDSLTYAWDRSQNVVLVIENGFAPHRVQESLIVSLADYETHELDDDRAEDERRRASAKVAERVMEFANTAGPRIGPPRARTLWVPAPERTHVKCDSSCEEHEDHSYLLRLSWPVMYAPPANPLHDVRIDSASVATLATADIGNRILSDFKREQPVIVARAIARGVAKYAITQSAKKEADKKNDALGDVVGALANITGALTEQADTRSWHLLPGSISIVRMNLAPGAHRLQVDGADFGTIHVRPSGMTVHSTRIWRQPIEAGVARIR